MPDPRSHYIPRFGDRQLSTLLQHWPAVFITGPRAVGKTTLALRQARHVFHLEEPNDRRLISDDPEQIREVSRYPLLIDEWQHVPEVLGTIKRCVDENPNPPGRFIIAGSARTDLHRGQWPGTGRFLDLHLWPITGRERFGDPKLASLFDRWDSHERFLVPRGRGINRPTITDYLRIALTGGFPTPIGISNASVRSTWMRTYVNASLTRDIGDLGSGLGRPRDPVGLRRYLQVCALNTAGVLPLASLARSSNLAHRTARQYHDIFTVLRIISDVPAWHSNRLKRLTSSSKLYLTDAGLAGWLMRTDLETLKWDADARSRILDTYVAAQLRAEAETAGKRVDLYHLRTQGGEREIDLVVEVGRQVVAFEIKSGTAPSRDDARHIAWLRDKLPPGHFAGGVVFHTGPHRYGLGDQIEAVPICGLWGERICPKTTPAE